MSKKIIFIGSFVSQEDSLLNNKISQAGIIFQEKVIKFIKPEINISLIPIFIKENKKFQYFCKVNFIHNVTKYKFFYKLYKFLFDSIETLSILKKSRINEILIYNLDKQNFLIILISKIFLKKKVLIIVADYAKYNNKIVDNLFLKIFSLVDAILVLNSSIKLNNKSKTMVGITYKQKIKRNKLVVLSKNIIMSGSLGKTTGFELALEYFSKNKEYTLHITGRPFRYSDEEFNLLIDKYIKQSSNIIYHGLIDYKEYLEILEQCDIALSLRNPNDKEHQYNFPSKIIEYLSNSKIVISSIYYEDLPPETLFYTQFNVKSLNQCLKEIFKLSINEINRCLLQNSDYLINNLTEENLIENINNLLEEV